MKKITILIAFVLSNGSLFSQSLPNITLKSLDGKSVNIKKLSNSKDVKVFAFKTSPKHNGTSTLINCKKWRNSL